MERAVAGERRWPGRIALGRLVPQGEVRRLAGPVSNGRFNARVERVLVAEGQAVRRGQVLVVMDSHGPLLAQQQRLVHQVAQLREQLKLRQRLEQRYESITAREAYPWPIWSSSVSA
ncbi:MAG: biotin/lipoyl-binding protein [Cyanobacteriota bacterium]